MKILLIDDQLDSRTYLVKHLLKKGYSIDPVSNIKDALLLVECEIYDAIAVNIGSYVDEQIKNLRKIKEIAPATEIIVVTSFEDMAHSVESLHDAIYAFLKQTSDIKTLASDVSEILNSIKIDKKLKRKEKELEVQNRLLIKTCSELEQLDRRKNEFSAMVAHEFHTPLMSIRASAETLIEEELTRNGQHKFLHNILSEVERLGLLSRDITDVIAMESGQFMIDLKLTNLNEVIDSAIFSIDKMFREKQIFLKKNLGEFIVKMDAGRIVQVVRNLLVNASQYTPEGGEIEITSYVKKEILYVEIADNGCGISLEMMDQIFDRYSQIATNKHFCSGIGLSVCRSIILLHHGEITVSNKKEGGAVFRFSLPMA